MEAAIIGKWLNDEHKKPNLSHRLAGIQWWHEQVHASAMEVVSQQGKT